MNTTSVHTTRKLEKTCKELIAENNTHQNEYLGAWNASIFYVTHKKCWLLINKLTRYVIILPNIRKTDLKNITKIFKERLHQQLNNDGIAVDYNFVEQVIGEIKWLETNNDSSASAVLNYNLAYLERWKANYKDFESIPFEKLNNRLNRDPVKAFNWSFPSEKMAETLNSFR